jgi:hypothetical protein
MARLDAHRPAARREFHRIRQQIEQDLLQPRLVGHDRRQIGADADDESHRRRFGTGQDQLAAGGHQGGQIDPFLPQLHPPGLDLG